MPFSFGLRHNPFILPRLDVVQRPLEMPLRVFQRRGFLVCLQVGMDEFDKAIYVFRCYLGRISKGHALYNRRKLTVSFCWSK